MIWWTLTALALFTQSTCVMASSPPPFDIRVTSAKDVIRYNTTVVFEKSEIKDYNNIEVYPKDQAVYVSAPNNVLKLSYRNGLTLTERYRWRPMPTDVEECRKKGPGDCLNNHIKILLLFNGTQHRQGDAIFICGTMGRNPECTERSTRNMTKALGLWGGEYRCPYNPRSSVTALMASDGFLYLGTSIDYGNRLFSILRRNQRRGSNMPELFTYQNDDRYLMEPFFVSSHEIGDYVYFFFHETSYESYTSCNQKITVSRVARVCKTDPGPTLAGRSSNKWTTYLKARMRCKKSKASDDAYNQITSTYIDARREYMYAVFTSSRHGPPGSILCRFRISDLHSVFNSNFKVQHKSRSREWVEEENRGIMGCPKAGDRDQNARSTLSKLRQLVSGVFRNDRIPPLFRDGERWTKTVETSVWRRRPGKKPLHYPIIFIATDAGTVLKVAKIKRSFCIVEIIEVEKGAVIKDLALVKRHPIEKSFLIATAATKIVRMGLHRCERFATKPLCVGARDPFCGWDLHTGTCVSVAGLVKSARYRQDLRGCPKLVRRLDGAWSSWGPWSACEQVAPETQQKQDCRCHLRTCSQPPPTLGGAACRGPPIQVTNCTIDGGWSAWSSWSGCSASCGYSKQFQVRRCDSPTPSPTGRRCRGSNEKSRLCQKPPCPMPTPMPVHGGWSAWNPWGACSVPCNSGFRKRDRSCTNPEPRHTGSPCYGSSWEYQKCNEQPCPDVQKLSQWTPWIRETAGSDLHETKVRLTRYRIACVARVPDARLVSTKMSMEKSSCDAGDRNCRRAEASPSPPRTRGRTRSSRKPFAPVVSNTLSEENPYHVRHPVMGDDDVDGGWSLWTEWSSCSLSCGGGRQQRSRHCNSPPPRGSGRPCLDKSIDSRPCNVAPCVGGGAWSCWSEWSRCDCANRVTMRVRNRKCRTREGLMAIDCPGQRQEEEACDESECFSGGWLQWTTWSVCRGGQQLRTRQCRHEVSRGTKNRFCAGAAEEQRNCVNVAPSQQFDNQFNLTVLIIVGVVCFFVGCFTCALGVFIWCCWKKQRRDQERSAHRQRSHSAPGGAADTLSRSMGISNLPPGPGSPLESESFPPWVYPVRPSFLDRQHSFHGTTTTSLGRQCSNTSSVRTPGKVDNCARWLAPMDSPAFAYSTMPRQLSNLRLPSTSTAAGETSSSRVPVWGGELTLPPRFTSHHHNEADAAMVMPLSSRRRGSEQDSVFLPSGQPPNETHQLLSSRFRVGE